jgi:iron complex outermembrane receptor protein
VAFRFDTGPVKHELLAGVDLSMSTADTNFEIFGPADVPLIDMFEPEYGMPIAEDAIPAVLGSFNTLRRLGVYAQDIVRFGPVIVMAGIRFDAFDESDEVAGVPTAEDDGTALSPRAGALWKIIPELSIYAGVGRSFQPHPVVDTIFVADELDPQTAMQVEAGVRSVLAGGHLVLGGAVYDIKRENGLLVYGPPGVPGIPDPNFETFDAHSQGVELSVDAQILPGWHILGGWTALDTEVTGGTVTGPFLPGVPDMAANGWTRYDFGQGVLRGLGVGVGAVYVGERPGDDVNSFRLPAYLRLDAAAYYKRGKLFGSVHLENLTDEHYIIVSNIPTFVQPGPPFQARLVLGFRYQ